MSGETTPTRWSETLQRRVHVLHQHIAALQRLVGESGGSEDVSEKACATLYRMLDEIYENDMPVARALDRSDLLLRLEGEGLEAVNPRLSLVTGIMGDVRQQVGAMIRTLVSSFNEGLELPREFDLGLSSFARGSLYLGFSLPEPGPGYVALRDDPFFQASGQALVTLAAVTRQLDAPDALSRIEQKFADPKLRDAALSAVGQLAPSGRRGVTRVSLGGRAFPAGAWPVLTPQTRLQVRGWLERPFSGREPVEVRGKVRAVDLDLRRFELRRIDGGQGSDVRCAYPAALDAAARGWLDATVLVRGRAESYQGMARLIEVESVRDAD